MKTTRPRCPTCGGVLGALAERTGEKGTWKAYVDPVDGTRLYRCPEHGRVAIAPDGTSFAEARA